MAGKIGHLKGASANEYLETSDTVSYDPPFYIDQNQKDLKGFASNASAGEGRTVHFDGSLCSSEYVSGASLQPSALQTLVCIKI